MSEKVGYNCLFEQGKECGIRTQWKLIPENMVEWCKVCRGQGTSESMKIFDRLITMIDDMRQKGENFQMAFMSALRELMIQMAQVQTSRQTDKVA